MKNNRLSFIQILINSFAMLGFLFTLNVIIAAASGDDYLPMLSEEFLAGKTIPVAYLQTIVAMLLVAMIGFYVSKIYQKDDWSIGKRTIVVFAISLTVFFLMMKYLGFLDSPYIGTIIVSILLFVIIYFAIWLKTYKQTKSDINDINNEIKKNKWKIGAVAE